MLTRFDHAVIAVTDLDAAVGLWRDRLGFDVQLGGRHTGRGTYNAIVRFGLDYIELISIYDRAEVTDRAEPNALALADRLDRKDTGLLGFAIASDDLRGDAVRFRRAGLEVSGPVPMERARPDGNVLQWHLAVPAEGSWGTPLPFFIQWDAPDSERLSWEAPGRHANGAHRIVSLAIAVDRLEEYVPLYSEQVGLPLSSRGHAHDLAAERASFLIGNTSIDLLAPAGAGPINDAIQARGRCPWQLTIAVTDMSAAARVFAQHGIELLRSPGTPTGLLVPPRDALGARIVLIEQPST